MLLDVQSYGEMHNNVNGLATNYSWTGALHRTGKKIKFSATSVFPGKNKKNVTRKVNVSANSLQALLRNKNFRKFMRREGGSHRKSG